MKTSFSIMHLVMVALIVLPLLAFLYVREGSISTHQDEVPSKYQAQVQEWEQRFEDQGTERAYDEFLRAGNAVSYYKAHSLSHIVGEIIFKRLGVRGIALCTPDFGYGCYHGFAGAFLAERGLRGVPDIKAACDSVANKRIAFGCVHGIGHGILAYVGNEELPRALEACAPLNAGVSDIGGCLGGIFMEYNYNTMRSLNGIDLRPYDESHAYEPCASEIPEQFRMACYYEQPSWWRASLVQQSASTMEEFKKIGALCEGIKDTPLRDICFRGVGNVIGPRSEYRANVMREWCNTMPDTDAQDSCFHEALGHLLQSEGGKRQLRALCISKEISYEDICRFETRP